MFAGQALNKRADDNLDKVGKYYDALLQQEAITPHDKAYVQNKREELDEFVNKISSVDYNLASTKATGEIFSYIKGMQNDPGLKKVQTMVDDYDYYQELKEKNKQGILDHNQYQWLESFEAAMDREYGEVGTYFGADIASDPRDVITDPPDVRANMEKIIDNSPIKGFLNANGTMMSTDQILNSEYGLAHIKTKRDKGDHSVTTVQEVKGRMFADLYNQIYLASSDVMNSEEGLEMKRQAEYRAHKSKGQLTYDEALEEVFDEYAVSVAKERSGVVGSVESYVDKYKTSSGSGDEEELPLWMREEGTSQRTFHWDSEKDFKKSQKELEESIDSNNKLLATAKQSGDVNEIARLEKEIITAQNAIDVNNKLHNKYLNAFFDKNPDYKDLESEAPTIAGINTHGFSETAIDAIYDLIEKEHKNGDYMVGDPRSGDMSLASTRIREQLDKMEADNIIKGNITDGVIKKYREKLVDHLNKIEDRDDAFDDFIEEGGGITEYEYILFENETEFNKEGSGAYKYLNQDINWDNYDLEFTSDYPTRWGVDTNFEDYVQGEYGGDTDKFINDIADATSKFYFNGVTAPSEHLDGAIVLTMQREDGTKIRMKAVPKEQGLQVHRDFYDKITQKMGLEGTEIRKRRIYQDIKVTDNGYDLSVTGLPGYQKGDKIKSYKTNRGNKKVIINKGGAPITVRDYYKGLVQMGVDPSVRINDLAELIWNDSPSLTLKEARIMAYGLANGEDLPSGGDTQELLQQILDRPYEFRSKVEALEFSNGVYR
jgi:hypothetical protein